MMVGIELPEDMTKDRLRQYVRMAIQCYRGGFLPEEDFFYINTESLTIAHMKGKKS